MSGLPTPWHHAGPDRRVKDGRFLILTGGTRGFGGRDRSGERRPSHWTPRCDHRREKYGLCLFTRVESCYPEEAAKGNGRKWTTAARIRHRGFTHEPNETQVALGLKKGEGQWEQAIAPSKPRLLAMGSSTSTRNDSLR